MENQSENKTWMLISDLRAEIERQTDAGDLSARSEIQDVRGSRVMVETERSMEPNAERVERLLDRAEYQGRETILVPRDMTLRNSLDEIESDTTRMLYSDGTTGQSTLDAELREDKDRATRLRAEPQPSPFVAAEKEEPQRVFVTTTDRNSQPAYQAFHEGGSKEDAVRKAQEYADGNGWATSVMGVRELDPVETAAWQKKDYDKIGPTIQSEANLTPAGREMMESGAKHYDFQGKPTGAEMTAEARANAIAERNARIAAQDAPSVSNDRIPTQEPEAASAAKERAENSIVGEPAGEPRVSAAVADRYGLENRTNDDRSVTYHAGGEEVMTDHGDRIALHGDDRQSIAAAVALANEKFPNGIEINVKDEAKRDAILEECARQGVKVGNPELQDRYDQFAEQHEKDAVQEAQDREDGEREANLGGAVDPSVRPDEYKDLDAKQEARDRSEPDAPADGAKNAPARDERSALDEAMKKVADAREAAKDPAKQPDVQKDETSVEDRIAKARAAAKASLAEIRPTQKREPEAQTEQRAKDNQLEP